LGDKLAINYLQKQSILTTSTTFNEECLREILVLDNALGVRLASAAGNSEDNSNSKEHAMIWALQVALYKAHNT